jgi:hypothetical protein
MSNGNQNTGIKAEEVMRHITAFMHNYKPIYSVQQKPDDITGAMKFFKDFFEKPEPQQKAPPGCFFLSSDSLNILTHVPNFQGISIYLGKANTENEILILVPVITGSDPENLYTLDVVANGQSKTLSTSQVLTGGSCPPPPPPCKNCPCP